MLLKLDLAETREFFAAFFALSDYHWHGFLSSRLSFLELIAFGLSLFAKSSNAARINLLQARRRARRAVACGWQLVQRTAMVGRWRGAPQPTSLPPPYPTCRKGCQAWL